MRFLCFTASWRSRLIQAPILPSLPADRPHARPEPERTVPGPHPPLLFNLDEDPYEQNDLSAAHPERVTAMQVELETWFESVEAERRGISD